MCENKEIRKNILVVGERESANARVCVRGKELIYTYNTVFQLWCQLRNRENKFIEVFVAGRHDEKLRIPREDIDEIRRNIKPPERDDMLFY